MESSFSDNEILFEIQSPYLVEKPGIFSPYEFTKFVDDQSDFSNQSSLIIKEEQQSFREQQTNSKVCKFPVKQQSNIPLINVTQIKEQRLFHNTIRSPLKTQMRVQEQASYVIKRSPENETLNFFKTTTQPIVRSQSKLLQKNRTRLKQYKTPNRIIKQTRPVQQEQIFKSRSNRLITHQATNRQNLKSPLKIVPAITINSNR